MRNRHEHRVLSTAKSGFRVAVKRVPNYCLVDWCSRLWLTSYAQLVQAMLDLAKTTAGP
jgi:hypothetical protein